MFKTFGIYWTSIRPYWFLLVLACITIATATTLSAFAPFYLRDIVSVFTEPEPNVLRAKTLLWDMAILFVSIYLVYRIFDFTFVFYEARIIRDLDQRNFAMIQRQSMRFFEDEYSGALAKQAIRFRDSFEEISDVLILELGRNAIMIISAFVIFLNTMPSFALAFGVWVVIFVVATWLCIRWQYPLNIRSAESDSEVTGAFMDSIGNYLTVKAFGSERAEQQRFDDVTQESYQRLIHAWVVGNISVAIQNTLMIIAEVGLIYLMIKGWENGTVTIADFIFFQSYAIWIMGALRTMGHSLRRLYAAIAAAEEMTAIYLMEPEVRDAPNAFPLVISEGHIDIHALSFSYEEDVQDEDAHTIHNISLKIPAGQTVGLVGRTGAGKSTFVKLLMRLYDVSSGYIRIDMRDIADCTQVSLRQQMAIVPQRPDLFHRTIRENIAFARPDATEEEVIEAARQAYAWEFIEKLPKGLGTLVGERGIKLSGGQCQRIAIARAILADPKILILDEATSAVDSETEQHIKKAIANLLRGRTCIVIAHRLSTIMSMDRIVVMENGRVLEDGTHEDLLRRKGAYANLWDHQSGDYLSEES